MEKVPGKWKLKVIKPEDRSNLDRTGSTAVPIGDENGDRFVDWLNKKSTDMNEKIREKVLDAKREIIIRKGSATPA